MYTDVLSSSDASVPETMIVVLRGQPEKQKRSTYQIPSNVHLQLFHVHSLMYNILEHVDVPRHFSVTESEFNEFVRERGYTLKKEELPKIASSDPVAMFIGLKPLEICRIERRSSTTCQATTFRLCV